MKNGGTYIQEQAMMASNPAMAWTASGEYGGGALTRQLGGEKYGPNVQAALAAQKAQAMGQGPSMTGFQMQGAQDQNMRQALQAQASGGLTGMASAQQGFAGLSQQTAQELAQRRAAEQQQMLQMYAQNLFSNQAINDDFASARERAFADMLLTKATGQLQHNQAMNDARNQQVGAMASGLGVGLAAYNNGQAQQAQMSNYSAPTMSQDQFGNTVANYQYQGE